MKNIYEKSWIADDFADVLKQSTLGFESLLELLNDTPANPSNYPAYDLVSIGNGETELSVAVAGFGKDEVSIEVANNILTISGKKEKVADTKYLYNGIAKRNFALRFPMYDNIEVTNASLDNGILTVSMTVAEDKKPKAIEIK